MDRTKKLVEELRRIKVDPSVVMCLGCGNEHNCGVHGCALIREAADTIERLNTFDKSNSYRLLRKNATDLWRSEKDEGIYCAAAGRKDGGGAADGQGGRKGGPAGFLQRGRV